MLKGGRGGSGRSPKHAGPLKSGHIAFQCCPLGSFLMKIDSFQAITSTIQTCTKQPRKTRPHLDLSGNNGSWVFLGFLSVRTESAGCVALFFKFLENAQRSPTQFCGKCAKCHLDYPEMTGRCPQCALGLPQACWCTPPRVVTLSSNKIHKN